MSYKIVELNSGVVYVEEQQLVTERSPNGKSYKKWVRVRYFDYWEDAKEWIKQQSIKQPDPRGVKREEIIDV